MSCAACQARVEKAVKQVPGVESVSVSLLTNSMGVTGNADCSTIIEAVENAGYGASLKDDTLADKKKSSIKAEEEALEDHETPKLKKRLALSAFFLIVLMYLTMGHNMAGFPLPSFLDGNFLGLTLTQLLIAITVMFINKKFFTSGFSSLIHRAPNMDTLVALGSSVSFGWSLIVFYRMCIMITNGAANSELMEIYHNELYFESAAMIPALITVGKMLEAMSKGRTTDALKSLMKLAPETAILIKDGVEVETPVEEVKPGDIFVIRPGHNIPVDGIVIEGSSAVDESALTGESIPVDKEAGDRVSAATISRSGFLKCRAERVGEDTTLAKIIQMVSDAAATKAPIARIADKVSGVFVPSVIAISVLVTAGWLITGSTLSFALARGISVLVISCPCALGLATPVAIMVGNGIGAKNGILFKTSESLENTGKVLIAALDKTGTITAGEPVVTDICPLPGYSEKDLLKTAYSLEKKSEHPLAGAIVKKAEDEGIVPDEALDFRILPGNGLEAVINGGSVHGGSREYIKTLTDIPKDIEELSLKLSSLGKTPLFFEAKGKLVGMIAVSDTLKPDSSKAVKELKELGLHVVMLTGDNKNTAEAIGREAGVDEVIAGVLPEGKERIIRTLQKSGKVVMVGDGINDAPALTKADIGIAIGAGTEVAIDSADIVLMNSSLRDVAAAIRLSRKTLVNIHQNLFWAFFYNAICIPLAAGLFPWKMNPMIGAAAMSISSFTVCMNALRLNLINIHDSSRDRPLRNGINGPIASNISSDDKTINSNKERTETMEKTLKIEGMMCGHCEATVKKALEALPFIEEAKVSHEAGEAIVKLSGEFDNEAVKKTIEDKDFTYSGVA